MSRRVCVLSKDELVLLHTGTLMSRRKALLKCEESFELSDQFGHGDYIDGDFIEFKNTVQWKQAYADLKQELSNRENVLSRLERKELRQAKIRQSK